jgi:hypothetical protein
VLCSRKEVVFDDDPYRKCGNDLPLGVQGWGLSEQKDEAVIWSLYKYPKAHGIANRKSQQMMNSKNPPAMNPQWIIIPLALPNPSYQTRYEHSF